MSNRLTIFGKNTDHIISPPTIREQNGHIGSEHRCLIATTICVMFNLTELSVASRLMFHISESDRHFISMPIIM